jgi:hypothetical protein
LLAYLVNEPEKLIEGSERLTSVFGYWTSFHDAEVIEFSLWRGDVEPDAGRHTFPVLTTKIHLWELTSELDARGYYVLRHHTLATLRFHDVDEFRMEGFNHQNAIFSLDITAEEREGGLPPFRRVEFQPAFGITSTFRCTRIEVIHAEPFPQTDRNAS